MKIHPFFNPPVWSVNFGPRTPRITWYHREMIRYIWLVGLRTLAIVPTSDDPVQVIRHARLESLTDERK